MTDKTYTKVSSSWLQSVTLPTQSDRLSSSPPTLSFDVAAAVADKGTVRSMIERYMAKCSAALRLRLRARWPQPLARLGLLLKPAVSRGAAERRPPRLARGLRRSPRRHSNASE